MSTLDRINQALLSREAKALSAEDYLLDSDMDSFSYAMFWMELDEAYGIFTLEYIQSIEYATLTMADIINRIDAYEAGKIYLHEYFYKASDLKNDEHMIISETKHSREQGMASVFDRLYAKELERFKHEGRTALLYIGGALEHHSMRKDYGVNERGKYPVMAQSGLLASRIAKKIEVDFLSINANACASGMYAIYEAKSLLERGYDDVIIYGEEWVEPAEILLFEQQNIPITCSDGLVILRLSKRKSEHCISEVNWAWHKDSSAFCFSVQGYKKAMKMQGGIDAVKMHGTGTENNTKAESGAIDEIYGKNKLRVEYKSLIGHSQGVSACVELCMALEDEALEGKEVLVSAAGLGNFYGACRVSC